METIKTEIQWRNPANDVPPFDEKIIVMLAGSIKEGLSPWRGYTVIETVSVSKASPNDDDDVNETYRDFVEEGKVNFDDFQFYLLDNDGDESDWYSDQIVMWAHYPAELEALALAELKL